MKKILGIVLTILGVAGYAVGLFYGITGIIAGKEVTSIFSLIILLSTISIGIGIGMICIANEKRRKQK